MAWYDELLSGASNAGNALLDTGKFAGEVILAAKAPAMYRALQESQNRSRNQQEREEFMTNYIGQKARPAMSKTMDLGSGAGPLEFSADAQQGSGALGGQWTNMQKALEMMKSPTVTNRTAGGASFRDLNAPSAQQRNIQTFTGGGVDDPSSRQLYRMGQDGRPVAMDIPAWKPSAGTKIDINNAGKQPGHWWSDEEKVRRGISTSKSVFQEFGKPPKVMPGRSEKEINAEITAESINRRLGLLRKNLSSNYVPDVANNIDQFGVPNAIANAFRSEDGQVYVNTMNSIVSDVVKEVSGLAATDKEFQRKYDTMAYTTFDLQKTIAHKQELLNEYMRDMNKRAGITIDDNRPGKIATPRVPEVTTPGTKIINWEDL